MKSDREFLDGIYEKAAVLAEREQQNTPPQQGVEGFWDRLWKRMNQNRRKIGLATSFCCIVLCCIVMIVVGQTQPQNPDPGKARSGDVMPVDLTTEPVAGEVVVTGTVLTSTRTDTTQRFIIQVDEVLRGNAAQQIEICWNTADGELYMEVEEQVLLACDQSDSGYVLHDGSKSKYSYVDTDATYGAYFLSVEGSFVYAELVE